MEERRLAAGKDTGGMGAGGGRGRWGPDVLGFECHGGKLDSCSMGGVPLKVTMQGCPLEEALNPAV